VKNVLLVVCLITIPFAFARAAVRLVTADNGACHSCSGAFTTVGPSGGPEMVCTTNNCGGGCKVQYHFFDDGYPPVEIWTCRCTGSPDPALCELWIERDFWDEGEVWIHDCNGPCLERGTCEGTRCTPEGTYWLVCNCNSH